MRLAEVSYTTRLWVAILSVALLVGCMKSPEEQYATYMESAAAFVAEGDHTSAALQFRNAARTNPAAAEPQYQLAKTYLEMGRLQECYRAIREAVTLDPDHTDATLLMAQILARLGDSDDVREAEGMLENVLGSRPDDVDALFALAVTRARLGSREDAEAFLEQALENAPDHLQSAVALARIRLSQDDREAAEEILRDAVAESADQRPARIALAQFLLFDGRVDEATGEIDGILGGDEDYIPALLARGLLHLRAGETDLAEVAYRRVADMPDTTHPTAYARVLAVNGKASASTAEFQRLYDADPSDRSMRTVLIVSILGEGEMDAAEALLTNAIAENDRDFDARLQRSEVYLRSNRAELARADVDMALEVQPTSAQAHYLLAKIHEASGNPTGARQELGESLRLQDDFLLARREMAQSLLRSVSRRSALDVLDEAPESQKNDPKLMSGRIWAQIALGDYDDAMTAVANTRSQLGELPDLRLQEGVIEAARGNHAKAEPLLEASLEAAPQDLRAFNALVATQMGNEQADTGLATVRRHANAHRQLGPLQLAAGTWFIRAGSIDEARDYLERSSALGDPTQQAEILLARLDERDGDDEAAMERLKAVTAKQSNHVGALVRLAVLQEKTEQFDDAETTYRAVLIAVPENVTALNNLAYLVATRGGSLDEALTLAQRAREHSPAGYVGTSMVEDTLGWIHYLRGSYTNAVLNLQTASDGAPQVAVIHYHLAMAQAKNGNPETARASYEAGRAIDPDLPEASEAEDLIR